MPTSVRFGINLNREAGKKAAAVSFARRVEMLILPVRSLEEKLVPFAASSVCDCYSR